MSVTSSSYNSESYVISSVSVFMATLLEVKGCFMLGFLLLMLYTILCGQNLDLKDVKLQILLLFILCMCICIILCCQCAWYLNLILHFLLCTSLNPNAYEKICKTRGIMWSCCAVKEEMYLSIILSRYV